MGIKYKIADKLDLPKDLILGAMNIHLTGNYEVYVENYKAIINYSSENIILKGRNNTVCIKGKRLCIDNFSKTDMIIKGYILEVSFDK